MISAVSASLAFGCLRADVVRHSITIVKIKQANLKSDSADSFSIPKSQVRQGVFFFSQGLSLFNCTLLGLNIFVS